TPQPLPRPASSPTATPCPPPVEANQAAEGVIDPISQPSAATSPSARGASAFFCSAIAGQVPLPPPDKEEEDFFAASDEPSLKQPVQESTTSDEEDRDKVLKAMAFIRIKLNSAFDPAEMFRVIQQSLSKVGRSIESLEAECQALELSGHKHRVYIPDLMPDVVEILEEEVLGYKPLY
ncbi:hypothetical protein HDU78_010799, partial [Chytriomyces hyalinus]